MSFSTGRRMREVIVENTSFQRVKEAEHEVGLLVGHVSEDKAFVHLLIKVADSAAHDELDIQSLSDSVAQVIDFLPGGVGVLGLYIAGQIANAFPRLQALCDDVQKDTGLPNESFVLLHRYPAGKLTGREHMKNSYKGNPPKELSVQLENLRQLLRPLTCRYVVRQQLFQEGSKLSFMEHILQGLEREVKRIQEGIGKIGPSFIQPSTKLKDLPTENDAHVAVELLVPPSFSDAGYPLGTSEGSGTIIVDGYLYGMAYAHEDDSPKTAIKSLKADLIQSLRIRGDLLRSELEDDGSMKEILSQVPSDQVFEVHLPQRATYKLEEGINLSVHILPEEGVSEVSATLAAVLHREIDQSNIYLPESKAVDSQGESQRKELKGLGQGRPNIPYGFKSGEQVVLISTIICLLSCAVSYFLYSSMYRT